MPRNKKTNEIESPTKNQETILSSLEQRMVPENSKLTHILTYSFIALLFFFTVFALFGGARLIKENSFFSARNNTNLKITLLKDKSFLLELNSIRNKEFRIYDSNTKKVTDITKGNKFIKNIFLLSDKTIVLEEKLGKTKIIILKDNQPILSIDSYLFTTDVERNNNDIYSFCPWSEIKPYHQKIAFFVCSSKKSKLLTISLNATLKTDTIDESISENANDGRIVEWIDEERILFSKINSKEDISIVEYNFVSKENTIIYGY